MVNCNDGVLRVPLSAPLRKKQCQRVPVECRCINREPAGLERRGNPRPGEGALALMRRSDPRLPLFKRVYRCSEAICLAPGDMLKGVDGM